jgi:hypothetical protein
VVSAFNVVDGAQRAGQKRVTATDASVLNKPIVVAADALSSASPTLPMDAAMPSKDKGFRERNR